MLTPSHTQVHMEVHSHPLWKMCLQDPIGRALAHAVVTVVTSCVAQVTVPLQCLSGLSGRGLPWTVESLPLFLPFISKNVCCNTYCRSRGLSDHILKTECDSVCSAAGSAIFSLRRVKLPYNQGIMDTLTPAISSVWDTSWACSVMICNFLIQTYF